MEPRIRPAASLDTLFGAQRGDQPSDLIQRYLTEVRRQLGMDVVYVAEFRDGRRLYRFVDGDHFPECLRVGASDPLDETYAQRVVDGRLAGPIRDSREDDRVRELSETRESGIAAFVGVPLVLSEDRVFGALCAFSRDPVAVEERQVAFLQTFARLVSAQLEHELGEWDDLRMQIERVEGALEPGGLSMVYQPVFDIRSRRLVGVEALARFPGEPKRSPAIWFDEARTVGRGVDLELAAVGAALDVLDQLPGDAFLSVNVSAETVVSPRLLRALAEAGPQKVVVEVPERAPVDDHYALNQAIQSLRVAGVRLAADDAGAGFESLSHILELHPEIIKFDVALTRDVDTDPVRRSLAAALVDFAGQFDATVVAEGVETESELETLRELGFSCAQGYFLARPTALPLGEVPIF